MAKFCSKCGKPLEDGKPCSCEGTVKTSSASQKGFGEMLKEYWELVKRVFKEPVTIVEENNSEDKFNLSLVSIAASGIAMGLFMCIGWKLFVALMAVFSVSMGSSSSGLASVISMAAGEVPYFKFFIGGFILVAGMYALMAAVGYLVLNKIFKIDISIKKMFVLVGMASIIKTVALVGCAVLSLLEVSEFVIYATLFLVVMSTILVLINFVRGIDKYAKVNPNMLGYAVGIMYIATIVIEWIILSKINL